MTGRAAWALAVLALVGCAKAAVVKPIDPAQFAAQQKAAQLALQRQQQAEQTRIDQARQLALAAEFTALTARHATLLTELRNWDAAGDARADLVQAPLQAWPKLKQLEPMVVACGTRWRELADKPLVPPLPATLAGQVRAACDVALRAPAIVQRQVVANARTFLQIPGWVRDAPSRYARTGRVSWHELLQLRDTEASYARRAEPYLAHATAVQAFLPRDEMLAPALQARARLLHEMAQGEARLAAPVGVRDAKVAAQVRKLWPAVKLDPEELGGEILQVVALDPRWQVLVGEAGRVTRQTREVAVVLLARTPTFAQGCWVVWAMLEQRGGATRLRRGDDVRWLRCPGAAMPSTELAYWTHPLFRFM